MAIYSDSVFPWLLISSLVLYLFWLSDSFAPESLHKVFRFCWFRKNEIHLLNLWVFRFIKIITKFRVYWDYFHQILLLYILDLTSILTRWILLQMIKHQADKITNFQPILPLIIVQFTQVYQGWISYLHNPR